MHGHELFPISIGTYDEASLIIIFRTCGVVELHQMLLVVPCVCTLYESLCESR